jgi:hypothetical protein
MGGGDKKGGDDNDIPQIDPSQLIQQAIQANRVGVNTPFGSQTYSTDANGNTVLNTALSPQMQALLGQQMARAGGAAPQYQLPGANADILNGLDTRLAQRYGIPVGGSGGSGSTPGTGGGGAPVPVPSPLPSPIPTPAPRPRPQPSPAPSGSGGGGGYSSGGIGGDGPDNLCVVADSLLPGGIRAAEAVMGHAYPVHLPEAGFHAWPLEYRGDLVKAPCVRLVVAGGASIRVSRTTPFTFPSASRDLQDGHWAFAPDMAGHSVFVLTPAGHEAREVERVEDIGEQWVVPLSFGGRSFAAGDNADALVYSHNIYKNLPRSGIFDDVQVLGLTGNTLGGSMDQSHAAAANFGFGPTAQPAYSGPGGYLGSGSYAGMGQGLAAANGDAPPTPAPPAPSAGFGLPPGPRLGTGNDSYGGTPQATGGLPAATGEGTDKPWYDTKTARAASLLLGPGAALLLGGLRHWKHRNDDRN